MIKIEKKIVNDLLKKIVEAGFYVNIDNGGDELYLPKATNNLSTIRKEMNATGIDHLILYTDEKYYGFVTLIYENGEDVISDCSVNLENLVW